MLEEKQKVEVRVGHSPGCPCAAGGDCSSGKLVDDESNRIKKSLKL